MSKKGWKKAEEEETLSGPIFKSISRLSGSSRQKYNFFFASARKETFSKNHASLSPLSFSLLSEKNKIGNSTYLFQH